MSDELPPPQLRLRPRKRDEESAPAPQQAAVVGLPASSDVPGGVAPVSDPALGRFRLKPKLTPGAEEPTADVPTSTERSALVAEDAVGGSRLKLKAVVASVAADQGDAVPALESQPNLGATPVESAVVAASVPADDSGAVAGPVPAMAPVEPPTAGKGITAPGNAAGAAPRPVVPPASVAKLTKPKSSSVPSRLLLGLLGFVVVVGGGGYYWFFMREDAPPPAPVVAKPQPRPVPSPAPVPKAPEPVAAAKLTPPETPAIAPLPAAPAGIEPLATGGPAPKPVKAPVVPVMTPAFRTWLEAVRINGVAVNASSAPRVIINGRLVRPGDTIDAAEGIVFESIDLERKLILFRNRAGFVASKPY